MMDRASHATAKGKVGRQGEAGRQGKAGRQGALRALALGLGLAALAAAALPAAGGPLGDELADKCFALGLPDSTACEVAQGVLGGLERPGVSAGDFRGDPQVSIDAANFYFSPKFSVMHDKQWVVFTNENPPGGNRHSVASSDWGCAPAGWLGACQPVLPVPGDAFGGGRAFKAPAPIQPEGQYALYIDTAHMDPRAYVDVGQGNYLVAYHCYIHGAAQMEGFLLVTGVQGP